MHQRMTRRVRTKIRVARVVFMIALAACGIATFSVRPLPAAPAPTAEQPRPRPHAVPGTFALLVFGQ